MMTAAETRAKNRKHCSLIQDLTEPVALLYLISLKFRLITEVRTLPVAVNVLLIL